MFIRHFALLFSLLFSLALCAQDEYILPYSATSVDEQKASEAVYLAYPTAIKDQVPGQRCGTEYSGGLFSVAENRQVMFAPGNLQYQASTGTWRFATNQYDYVGDATNGNVSEGGVKCDNGKVSGSYSGWIDLFGWGTSGWNSGANAYQPYSTSTSYSDYYPGSSSGNNLTGEYANADWGIYNQIGSDPAGTWRTLTKDEWVYLFYTRPNAATLFGLGSVAGVNGTILLPDGWELPSGVTFTPSTSAGLADQGTYFYNSSGNNFSHNTYTAVQWQKIMEPSGAVFLPASGDRYGTAVNLAGQGGGYWSSTQYDANYAYYLYFRSYGLNPQGYYYRYYGGSVRLARVVEE